MKLSIAIPAYNAEKSLARTVESILAQTFRDFEILIVNNGSVDKTGEVARELAAKDPRITVFDVYPNIQGYGARLYAWRRAKGEFITSVDADDWIEPDMYAEMLRMIDENNLDVVQCDIFGEVRPPEGALDTFEGDALKKEIYRKFIDIGEGAYIWNKVYRNQYDFLQWKEGPFGNYEDLVHNLQLFRPVRRFGHLHRGYYHYIVTSSSATRKFRVEGLDLFPRLVATRADLVRAYGVADNDSVLNRWVVNEFRNAFITAATVGRGPWRERMSNVRAVLEHPELISALTHLSCNCRGCRMLQLARRLPQLVTVGLRFVNHIRGR